MAGTNEEQAATLRNLFGDDTNAALAADIDRLPRPFTVSDEVSNLLEDALLNRIREFSQDPAGFTDGILDAGLRDKLLRLRKPTLPVHGNESQGASEEDGDEHPEEGVVEGGAPPTRVAAPAKDQVARGGDREDRGGRGREDRGHRREEGSSRPSSPTHVPMDKPPDPSGVPGWGKHRARLDALFVKFEAGDRSVIPDLWRERDRPLNEPIRSMSYYYVNMRVVSGAELFEDSGFVARFGPLTSAP